MSVYIELFHGRKSPDEELDDWGEIGPVLGPLDFVHTTYAGDIKVRTSAGVDGVLYLHEDMLYYAGMWYGDWSVFSELEAEHCKRLVQFEQAMSSAMSAPIDESKCEECGQLRLHQNHWAPFGWHDFVGPSPISQAISYLNQVIKYPFADGSANLIRNAIKLLEEK